MAKVVYKSYNQNDSLLFPHCIGDFIPENDPVRVLDAIVEHLDISAIEATYKGGGASSFAPRMLLKVILYAYLQNIHSGRKMEALLKRDVNFMWLSGMQRPDYNTINLFRKHRLADVMDDIFTQVVQMLVDAKFVSLEVQYIDGTKIAYASVYGIDRILTKFLPPYRLARFPGWTRNTMSDTELGKWKEKNKECNVSGKWYHVHLKEAEESKTAEENKEREKYIRIGSVEIVQEFTPEQYTKIKMAGNNYDAVYDTKRGEVNGEGNYSSFSGEYTLDPKNKKIVGIYSSKRTFRLGNQLKNKQGIHEFSIVTGDKTVWIDGTFQDAAPSASYGVIVLFRKKEDRDRYVLKHRKDVMEKKQGE